MTQAHNDFGRVASLKADAIGEPGQRIFRLLVEAADGRSAILLVEKEQLFNLALAFMRLMVSVGSQGGKPEEVIDAMAEIGEPLARSDQRLDLDLRQGSLAAGYDERQALYVITGSETESSEEVRSDVRLMADRATVDALAEEAIRVCAAGRPPCPLCSAPLGPEPHICPKQNGHHARPEA